VERGAVIAGGSELTICVMWRKIWSQALALSTEKGVRNRPPDARSS